MRADEARELASKGQEQSGVVARLSRLGTPAKWLAASLLGAVIVAAVGQNVTDYYADKQQSLDLEASLLKTINRGATSLYTDAQRVASAKQGERQVDRYRQMLAAWQAVGAESDAVFSVYYRGSGGNDAAYNRWRTYHGALYQYGRLACCETGRDPRRQSVNEIRRALKSYDRRLSRLAPDEWKLVTTWPHPPKRVKERVSDRYAFEPPRGSPNRAKERPASKRRHEIQDREVLSGTGPAPAPIREWVLQRAFEQRYKELGLHLLRALPALGDNISPRKPNSTEPGSIWGKAHAQVSNPQVDTVSRGRSR